MERYRDITQTHAYTHAHVHTHTHTHTHVHTHTHTHTHTCTHTHTHMYTHTHTHVHTYTHTHTCRVMALVIENTFTSIPKMAQLMFPGASTFPLFCFKNKVTRIYICRHCGFIEITN